MRETPYMFIGDVKAENTQVVEQQPAQTVIEQKPEPKPENAEPAQPKEPEKPFFEKYKWLLIIAFIVALVIFFWKFKIVSKAALAAATAA